MDTLVSTAFGMAPEDFVDALYRHCLGRAADHSGLLSWTQLIHSKGDPTLVLKGILESAEYKARGKSTAYKNTQASRQSFQMSVQQRVEMTVSCRDCDPIPKVPGAGDIIMHPSGVPCQRMHNGTIVVAGGYYGEWMSEVIRRLRGHHEPQEEMLFHAILPFTGAHGSTPVMVELGSFWSYYSLWFRSVYPDARSFLVEPDANNVLLGKRNFELNGFSGEFIEAAVGTHDAPINFRCESDGISRNIRTIGIDGLTRELGLERIDMLHADIQGAELAMLAGMEESIKQGRVKWLFLSTHHHSISGDPLTHQRCLAWLRTHDAFIVGEHSVPESFSGDGLIVAVFGGQPEIPLPPVSRNKPSSSLFGETEYDLAAAWEEIRRLREMVDSTSS